MLIRKHRRALSAAPTSTSRRSSGPPSSREFLRQRPIASQSCKGRQRASGQPAGHNVQASFAALDGLRQRRTTVEWTEEVLRNARPSCFKFVSSD
ncbi:hypothetical protein L596_001301 [Steinernema carpocapsae]|uniref:Uncharacterized protein n=1 Tax=Steinernema carpocapsae TaxID=34508 RepID=A0A4U8UND1_STECR|nr:hypothetical protein L596_001301 [Steinernema carpocapsae]